MDAVKLTTSDGGQLTQQSPDVDLIAVDRRGKTFGREDAGSQAQSATLVADQYPVSIMRSTFRRTVSLGSPVERAIAERLTGRCSSAGTRVSSEANSRMRSDVISHWTLRCARAFYVHGRRRDDTHDVR